MKKTKTMKVGFDCGQEVYYDELLSILDEAYQAIPAKCRDSASVNFSFDYSGERWDAHYIGYEVELSDEEMRQAQEMETHQLQMEVEILQRRIDQLNAQISRMGTL